MLKLSETPKARQRFDSALAGAKADPLKRRFVTVDDYHRMIEAGVFDEDEPLELLDGEIVKMLPIGPGHSGHAIRLVEYFQKFVSRSALVSSQNPFIADEFSEPQPDTVLLKRRADYYTISHPLPKDVLLLVEIAESSLSRDRIRKMFIYARNGIQEYWILNLIQ